MRTRTILGCLWTGMLFTALASGCSSAEGTQRGDGSSSGTGSGSGSGGDGSTGDGSTGAGTVDGASANGTTGSGSGSTGSGGASNEVVTAAASTSVTPVVDGVGGTFIGNRNPDGPADACQEFDIQFTPDIPTVYVLVDRSSSMWPNFWDPLRDGVLQVIERLHQDVRFGMATYTGDSTTCPVDLEEAGPIALNNYDTIANFWTTITNPNMATETPTAAAIQAVQGILEQDATVVSGSKFILLVTDGNPDYCDNGDDNCRADTTVRALQDAYASTANITTFVVVLPDDTILLDWVNAFANAGAGQPVELVNTSVEFCGNNPPPADTQALFPYDFPQGTYSDAGGTATPFSVDPANQDALVAEIGSVVAGVKSCVFDLENELEINVDRADEGSVVIKTVMDPEGTAQPYDPAGTGDGWTVNADGGVELVGAACDLLRTPETTGIEFGFPCDIIIPK